MPDAALAFTKTSDDSLFIACKIANIQYRSKSPDQTSSLSGCNANRTITTLISSVFARSAILSNQRLQNNQHIPELWGTCANTVLRL